MYDELIKTIRKQCSDMDCGNCNTCVKLKAADAIEELQKRVPKRPHGCLIDADKLKDGKFVCVENPYARGWNDAIETIMQNAPTIIEAEGE